MLTIFQLLNEHWDKVKVAKENKQLIPQGKPVLIVVPPNLLSPWAEEISCIARKERFEVVIYKSSVFETGFPQHMTHIKKPIDRETLLSSYGAKTIILTTYHSFNQRHGSRAIRAWQRKNGLPIVAEQETMPSNCPSNLSGCFSTAILDEGHMLRNSQSRVHRTLTWLNADFYILVTATPFYNAIADFHGYVPFLFCPELISRSSNVSSTNSFEVPDDDPAAVCRFTHEAVSRYILRRGTSAETAGANMRKILQDLMIRRTYFSQIPFKGGITIGSEIPLAHRKKIEVEWENAEEECYQKLSEQYRKSLLCKSEETSKYMWNIKAYRSLVLLSAWLGMPFVEKSLSAAGFPLAILHVERNIMVSRWMEGLF